MWPRTLKEHAHRRYNFGGMLHCYNPLLEIIFYMALIYAILRRCCHLAELFVAIVAICPFQNKLLCHSPHTFGHCDFSVCWRGDQSQTLHQPVHVFPPAGGSVLCSSLFHQLLHLRVAQACYGAWHLVERILTVLLCTSDGMLRYLVHVVCFWRDCKALHGTPLLSPWPLITKHMHMEAHVMISISV